MSDCTQEDHRLALHEARAALEIVHAQYHRALTRAARAESAERASALGEARRLLGGGCARARDPEGSAAAVPAERREATGRNRDGRPSYEHVSV